MSYGPTRAHFRQAWRDLKTLTRENGAVAWTRPRLRRTPDELAIAVQTVAISLTLSWPATVEVPLDIYAYRLRPALLRALQRLARGEIRRSSRMAGDEWARVQDGRNLGLVRIERGDGWEAEITEAGAEALRCGSIPHASASRR